MRFFLTACLLVVAWNAAAQEKPRRFPLITEQQLDEKQKAVAEVMKQKTLSGIGGPNNVLLRSPALADSVMRMTDYLRYNSSVPLRLNELAILLVARQWDSQFEWGLHVPAALKAGLAQNVIDEIGEGRRPAGMKDDEVVVHDFVQELLATRSVSDATFERTKAALGEQQVVDLIGVTGFYVMLAMVLNTAEIPLPAKVAASVKPFTPIKR